MHEQLDANQLEQLITQHDIVFVDFWAEWCAPCKAFGVVFEQVSQQFPEVVFAKVNVEGHPDLADALQIRSIPHLVVFKQGMVVYSDSGNMPESTLKDLVKQAKEVDVGHCH